MQVVLDSGVALYRVFMMIETYPLLARRNAFFPTDIKSYRGLPTEGRTSDDLAHGAFGKIVEMMGHPSAGGQGGLVILS